MKATSKSAKCSSFQPLEIKTTWGTITLMLDDSGKAVELDLPYLKAAPRKTFRIGTAVPAVRRRLRLRQGLRRDTVGEASLPSNLFQWLEDKFQPAGIPAGTGFQQAVWKELKKIPCGQTRTYGEIAAAIGHPKAARAVGSACGANPLPLFIPCHRVTAKTGLGGFGSGLPWKKLLLRMEGWRKENGMVE